MAGVLLGLAALYLPQMLSGNKKLALNDRELFEAHLVASDLLEVGKFLILYERVFFQSEPLGLTGSRQARGDKIRSLWAQFIGSNDPSHADLNEACGTHDVTGTYTGSNTLSTGILSSEKVFCPLHLRSPAMSGSMMEKLMLDNWLANGVFSAASRPGAYTFEVEMTSALDPEGQGDLSIRMFFGQKLIEDRFGGFLGGGMTAKLRFEILTDSAGFRAVSSERFVRITGLLDFRGARGVQHRVEKSETMMLALSTPQSFAFFVPFPAGAGGGATNSFRSAVRTIPGNAVKLQGRSYFNGNIDQDLAQLPEFREAVVVSGNVIPPGGKVPGPADLTVLKQKFRKGIVTNLSAERYLYDGACAQNNGSPVMVLNGTRFGCPPGFGIGTYVDRLENVCSSATATKSCGTERVVPDTGSTAAMLPECQINLAGLPAEFLHGGFRKIVANGVPCTSIMSPAVETEVSASATVFGTIFGGYVNFKGAADVYSLTSMQPVLPGLNNGTELGAFNSASVNAYEGVTVPLFNLPVVMATGGEGQP